MDAQLLRHVSQLLPGEEVILFCHILFGHSCVWRGGPGKEEVKERVGGDAKTRVVSKDVAGCSKCSCHLNTSF